MRIRARRRLLQPMLHSYLAVDEATLRGEDPVEAELLWHEAREQRGADAVDQLVALVQGLDGVVHEEDPRQGVVISSVPDEALAALANDARLAAVELEEVVRTEEPDNPAGYWLNVYGPQLDGIEVESLIQSIQFYGAGIHGQGEQIGMIEGVNGSGADNVRRVHPGFDDVHGDDRYQNRKWSWPGIWSNPNPSTGSQHPTAVASVIIGDITRGQHPAVTTAWERRRRSGVARRSSLLGMSISSQSRVVNQMTDPNRDIRVVNRSSTGGGDPKCEGRDSWSRTANELFESGVVLIKSAGNGGWDDLSNCQVSSPGAAIGAFTVGAFHPNQDGSGTHINELSSRGGTPSQGRGRTVVDVVAPTRFQAPYVARPGCGFSYGAVWDEIQSCPAQGADLGRTSGSAPMVTGGFSLMHSWYRNVYGSLAPGALHTLLLLMGDRRDEAGTFMTTGYDGLWGAGRLRLRRVDSAGLDGPTRWTAGSRCVGHGTSVIIPVTTSDVTSDVDVQKAVAYLYDSRHDDTGSVNNDRVSLSLMREISTGFWTPVATDLSTDNKMRVFLYNPAPGRYAIRLSGISVSSDHEGCGTNSTRVWFSYMHEDSDREPAEGLHTVRPEDEDIP